MHRFLQDLRHATRGLVKTPVFSLGVIATLALGIGINATMFGVVDTLFLKPPAGVVDPGSVTRVYLRQRFGDQVYTQSGTSYPSFLDMTKGTPQFTALAAVASGTMSLGRGADAREVSVVAVSHGYFGLVGVRPVGGRFFTAADDRVGGNRVAVISDRYWRERFGRNPAAIGSILHMGKQGYTVVGVTQPGFVGVDVQPADVFIPIVVAADGDMNVPASLSSHGYYWLSVIGRLAPGVTRAAAATAATRAYRVGASTPRRVDSTTQVLLGPVQSARGPDTSSDAKVALWIAVLASAVLLIACANVTNLLLARGASRRRELAVRASLGAARRGLIRLMFSESVVLALVGGGAALAFAVWGGATARAFLLPDLPSDTALIEPRMLLFTAGAVVAVTLLIGLVPALQATRVDLASALKRSSRGATSQGQFTRAVLLVVQVALTLTLLVGAGLFVQSLRAVQGIDPGLDAGRVYTVQMDLSGAGMSQAAANDTYLRLADQYRRLPGVEAAAASMGSPYNYSYAQRLRLEGLDSVPSVSNGGPYFQAVTTDYFRTLGVHIVAGRAFNDGDRAGTEPVAVMGATFARMAWPHGSPIGKCLFLGADSVTTCTRIVGVAADVRRGRVTDEESLLYYLPYLQHAQPTISSVFVRARPGARGTVAALQREVTSQGSLPYAEVRSLAEEIGLQARSWRLGATAFTAFGVLALIIAALGVFAVLSYGVTQRTREIGVRVALGAQSAQVVRMIVLQGLTATLLGVAVGAIGALALGRAVASLLYQVKPTDPAVMGTVTAVLVGVAALAAYLPARRAARVEPTVALRAE